MARYRVRLEEYGAYKTTGVNEVQARSSVRQRGVDSPIIDKKPNFASSHRSDDTTGCA